MAADCGAAIGGGNATGAIAFAVTGGSTYAKRLRAPRVVAATDSGIETRNGSSVVTAGAGRELCMAGIGEASCGSDAMPRTSHPHEAASTPVSTIVEEIRMPLGRGIDCASFARYGEPQSTGVARVFARGGNPNAAS